jgi:hypothetical protein
MIKNYCSASSALPVSLMHAFCTTEQKTVLISVLVYVCSIYACMHVCMYVRTHLCMLFELDVSLHERLHDQLSCMQGDVGGPLLRGAFPVVLPINTDDGAYVFLCNPFMYYTLYVCIYVLQVSCMCVFAPAILHLLHVYIKSFYAFGNVVCMLCLCEGGCMVCIW